MGNPIVGGYELKLVPVSTSKFPRPGDRPVEYYLFYRDCPNGSQVTCEVQIFRFRGIDSFTQKQAPGAVAFVRYGVARKPLIHAGDYIVKEREALENVRDITARALIVGPGAMPGRHNYWVREIRRYIYRTVIKVLKANDYWLAAYARKSRSAGSGGGTVKNDLVWFKHISDAWRVPGSKQKGLKEKARARDALKRAHAWAFEKVPQKMTRFGSSQRAEGEAGVS